MRHLIIQHIPRLRRYARALLQGDRLAADDLVQDCLERALSRKHHWKPGTDLRAWLFTIMHNLYANQVRRGCNGPRFVPLAEGEEAPSPATGSGELELQDLTRAMEQLSPEQRELLLLVSLEGLSYREAAQILGVAEGTVMSRLSRARQQLRAQLEGGPAPRLRRIK